MNTRMHWPRGRTLWIVLCTPWNKRIKQHTWPHHYSIHESISRLLPRLPLQFPVLAVWKLTPPSETPYTFFTHSHPQHQRPQPSASEFEVRIEETQTVDGSVFTLLNQLFLSSIPLIHSNCSFTSSRQAFRILVIVFHWLDLFYKILYWISYLKLIFIQQSSLDYTKIYKITYNN